MNEGSSIYKINVCQYDFQKQYLKADCYFFRFRDSASGNVLTIWTTAPAWEPIKSKVYNNFHMEE